MNIIWLASYPKSGNTWLRFFLFNYLHGNVRSSKQVEDRMGLVRKGMPMDPDSKEPHFRKTHLLFNDRHPYLDQTRSFIYLMRHPKDVLLSNLNYFRLCVGEGVWDDRQFVLDFIEHLGVRHWHEKGFGSWPEHLQSWLAEPRHPHLVLRYEDMLDRPHDTLRGVIEFLGLAVDPIRLKQAVHRSSFEKMRALESTEKKKGRFFGAVFSGNAETHRAGYQFMNRGRAGQSIAHLGEDVEQLFNERFAGLLTKWGYTP